jgi:tetratricopeptide (TPR) repeat protein
LSKNMADKRKSFRARRLAFGGRIFPRACILAAALALLTASLPLRAQDAGLKNGAVSLAAGKYDAAVRQLSATVNSDSVSPSDAAKALYLRGIAYRKMGEPARAVADLGAAIWLGLPQVDRIKALVNRGLAYQAAGLSKEAEAELAAARKLGGSREVDDLIADGGGAPAGAASIAAFATEVTPGDAGAASASNRARSEPIPNFSTSVSGGNAPPPPSEPPPTRTANASPGTWSTSVADESQPANSSGGNRLTRWFGSLTDSSSESAAPAPTPAPASTQTAQPPKPAAPPSAAASSSWSTSTETQDAASAGGAESKSRWSRLFGRTAEADPTAQPAAAAAPSAGGAYRLQLATSRSEAEAQALWKKVSQSQGLGGISPLIERVDIGNFGTFYSLRIGPFPDKAESLKVCNALKRSGIDCSPAEQ